MKALRILIALAVFLANTAIAYAKPGWVVITFDDGKKGQRVYGLSSAVSRDLRGTIFIITSKVGDPDYISWDDVKAFVKAGWTVGCHTETHPDLRVLSISQIDKEMWACKALIETKIGLALSPTMFASPYGFYNNIVLDLAKVYYDAHFKAWEENGAVGVSGFPIKRADRYEIPRFEVKRQTPIEEVCAAIQNFTSKGKLMVLMFHDISPDDPPKGQEQWVLSVHAFDAIMSCIARLRDDGKLVVLTAEEAVNYQERPPEAKPPTLEEKVEVAARPHQNQNVVVAEVHKKKATPERKIKAASKEKKTRLAAAEPSRIMSFGGRR